MVKRTNTPLITLTQPGHSPKKISLKVVHLKTSVVACVESAALLSQAVPLKDPRDRENRFIQDFKLLRIVFFPMLRHLVPYIISRRNTQQGTQGPLKRGRCTVSRLGTATCTIKTSYLSPMCQIDAGSNLRDYEVP